MILAIAKDNALPLALDQIGLRSAVQQCGSVLIKINLSHPPAPLHPRTDPNLLTQIIQYIARLQGRCAVAEGANGFLQQNLESIGLEAVIQNYQVKVIDLDLEEADCVVVDDEQHYLPKCLKDYPVRLGLPATSQRPGMVFSNNIKLFVGAIPRRMYQNGQIGLPRPRVHIDLHKSVANIYRAIMSYAPFDFFVNGGTAMFEGRGEIDIPERMLGNDALELDQWILNKFGIEPPDYVKRLEVIGNSKQRVY